MSEFREILNEQLQDDEFREQWEKIQPEMDLIRAVSVLNSILNGAATAQPLRIKISI